MCTVKIQISLCIRAVSVVGWGKGVVYLVSLGHPTDIGLQLGKACYHCSRWGVEGECFYFFCFFTFIHFPSPLSLSFISSTISSISPLPFSERRHKMTHKGWSVIKPQHNQSIHAVWSESSLGTFWIAMHAKFLHADKKDWSDCTDTQAVRVFDRWHVRRYIFSHCSWISFFAKSTAHLITVIAPYFFS